MPEFTLKPTHKAVKVYYETMAQYSRLLFDNETNLRGPCKRCWNPVLPRWM